MKMNNKHSKILFLVQLTPPYHGAALANENVVYSQLVNNSFSPSIIDIKTSHELGKIGRFSLSKLFLSVRIFFKIFVRLLRFKPDLVHFSLAPSGFAFYRDALYLLLIKMMRYKKVLHLHGKGFRPGINKNYLYRFLCKKIFAGSYCIHLSRILSNDVQELGIKKRYIIPYGIKIINEKVLERNDTMSVKILYLSNYIRSKGVLDLIDAVEILAGNATNFHVELVGNPYDLSIKYLEEYIQEKKLQHLITVGGPKYNEDKYEALRNAGLFVFPTHNDAFPNALLEAMQFGLPCITTTEGGIPDMIDDGITGFIITPGDKEGMSRAILTLLQNHELRNQMGINAQKVFFSKYTLPVFERNIVNTFNDIIADK
jgi:glycosyltransferase involved in cell wall biosynthesis